MSGQTSAGQEQVAPRPRRSGPREGRIVTNVPSALGCYIEEEAKDLGITPSTMVRMMLVECIKARGLTLAALEEKYPKTKFAVDGRTREARELKAAAVEVPEDVAAAS